MNARARKVLRVVWLPFLGAILAGALANAAGRDPQLHRGSLLVVVPASRSVDARADALAQVEPGASTTSTTIDLLGRPSEAQRLAGTYATLIPADTATLTAVAEALDRPPDDLRGKVRATAVGDSSLIRVTLEVETEDEARVGIAALGEALTGRPPASPAVAPGSMVLVSIDEPVTVGGRPSSAVPAAVVAGAMLGAFAAVAWTRQDRRVDGTADLDALDLPTIELDSLDRPTVQAAVSGVLVASGLEVGDETPVHLLAAGRGSDPLTARIAALLPSRLGPVGPPRIRFPRGGQPMHLGPPVLYGGAVSGAPSPAALAEPGVAVVVVRRGARFVEVARAVATIERFGSVVAGLLIAKRDASPGTGSASRSAVEGASPRREYPGLGSEADEPDQPDEAVGTAEDASQVPT